MVDKIVLVTGASSGLGRSIALHLTQIGFVVYGTSRNPGNVAKEGFVLLPLDVTEPDSVRNAVKTIIEEKGSLDILINNAGVGITGPMEEIPYGEALKCFDTNFHGPLNVIKEVLPHMRNQGKGLIINTSSIAGFMGLPYRGVYSASKAALAVATEAIRMETKNFGITVVDLAPGDYVTNIAAGRYHVPAYPDSPYAKHYGDALSRMNEDVNQGGNPEEVAQMVAKLISKKGHGVHYTVGAPLQRFSVWLKKILPDKVFEKLLLKHYKL